MSDLRKYIEHKHNAKKRNVDFLLTFEEWYQTWLDSGHLNERGQGVGKYQMGRFGDEGPYAIGNIKIILHSENVTEGNNKRFRSPAARQAISNSNSKRYVSEETKAKIGNSLRGRTLSQEHKKNIIEGMKANPLSEEAREKIRSTHRGRIVTSETRAKLSAANKGKVFTDEHRANLARARKRGFQK